MGLLRATHTWLFPPACNLFDGAPQLSPSPHTPPTARRFTVGTHPPTPHAPRPMPLDLHVTQGDSASKTKGEPATPKLPAEAPKAPEKHASIAVTVSLCSEKHVTAVRVAVPVLEPSHSRRPRPQHLLPHTCPIPVPPVCLRLARSSTKCWCTATPCDTASATCSLLPPSTRLLYGPTPQHS